MARDSTAFAQEPPLRGSDLHPGTRVRPAEWLVPAAISAALFAACVIVSPKKPMWFDEVISWTIAKDRSISHMLRALAHGADGMPPTYYLVAQLWRGLFGSSPLLLRLLSPAGFAVGAFAALRRVFTAAASGLAVIILFCIPWIILFQSTELRPYGTLMGLAGTALWLCMRSLASSQLSMALVAENIACHAALVLCHPFGILYSAAIACALVVSGVRTRRPRSTLFAAITVGCSAILLWVLPFLRLAEMSRPRSLSAVPSWHNLGASYAFGMKGTLAVIAVLLLAGRAIAFRKDPAASATERKTLMVAVGFLAPACLLILFGDSFACAGAALALGALGTLALRPAEQPRAASTVPLLYVAAAFLLLPVFAFLISRIYAPVFMARYLLPSEYGIGILVASAFDNIGWPPGLSRVWLWRAVCAVMMALAVAVPVMRASRLRPTDIPLFATSRRAVEGVAPPIRAVAFGISSSGR
jgi:uncharacterized membrane protein